MSLRTEIKDQLFYHAQDSAKRLLILEVGEDLGIADLDFYFSHETYPEPTLKLEPKHIPGVAFVVEVNDGPSLKVVDASPTLGAAAKVLLQKLGKFEKGFDETYNRITLTARYKGVKIVLQDATPETCTVEKVVEEVTVPEHKEKRVRYVLKGDCDPLMSSKEYTFNEGTEQTGAATLGEVDIPPPVPEPTTTGVEIAQRLEDDIPF